MSGNDNQAPKDLQEGDEVQWKFGGSGHPTGTVEEVSSSGITIEGKNSGAPIHRNGTEDDPAVRLDKDGVEVVKRAHELHKTGESVNQSQIETQDEEYTPTPAEEKAPKTSTSTNAGGENLHKKNTEAHKKAMAQEEAHIDGKLHKGSAGGSSKEQQKAPQPKKEPAKKEQPKKEQPELKKPETRSDTRANLEANDNSTASEKAKSKAPLGDIAQHNQDLKAASVKKQSERIRNEQKAKAAKGKSAGKEVEEESSDADEDEDIEMTHTKSAGDKRTRDDGTPDVIEIKDQNDSKKAKNGHGDVKKVSSAKQTKTKPIEVEA